MTKDEQNSRVLSEISLLRKQIRQLTWIGLVICLLLCIIILALIGFDSIIAIGAYVGIGIFIFLTVVKAFQLREQQIKKQKCEQDGHPRSE